MATLKKPSFYRDIIFFSVIEFFSPEEVTLIGQIEEGHGLEQAQYITDKRTLYRLLKNSGKLGQEIIHLIVDTFKQPHEVPVRINLQEHFGRPVCLESCLLKLDRSYYQADTGDWKVDYDTNLFFIDQVEPLPAAA
ncbi:MAG: hypothetical protein U0T84_12025 [Chitinophagales bacterium]